MVVFLQERITLAEKNERLQSQLRSLKEDLANTRDDQVWNNQEIFIILPILLIPGWDNYGQDPQGEREAREGQVQDAQRGQEGQHQEEGWSIREHVEWLWWTGG